MSVVTDETDGAAVAAKLAAGAAVARKFMDMCVADAEAHIAPPAHAMAVVSIMDSILVALGEPSRFKDAALRILAVASPTEKMELLLAMLSGAKVGR